MLSCSAFRLLSTTSTTSPSIWTRRMLAKTRIPTLAGTSNYTSRKLRPNPRNLPPFLPPTRSRCPRRRRMSSTPDLKATPKAVPTGSRPPPPSRRTLHHNWSQRLRDTKSPRRRLLPPRSSNPAEEDGGLAIGSDTKKKEDSIQEKKRPSEKKIYRKQKPQEVPDFLVIDSSIIPQERDLRYLDKGFDY